MPTCKMYQMKRYRDRHLPVYCEVDVLVSNELLTPEEFTKWCIPREWCRLVEVNPEAMYNMFGARFAEPEDITVLQEVI